MLYALRSPSGHLIEETVAGTNAGAWSNAFNFFCYLDGWEDFEARYWKQWTASRRYARRRGWIIVKCKLSEVK